jgi:uroporphyrin-III C-methyltransferase
MNTGFVYIVGAGPGDPELITVKALRYLRQSDVVLHDRLVAPQLLAEAGPDALRINVGKRAGSEDEQQQTIHRLMISHARSGKQVCRLKGGDPFVFGRGGEEVAALIAARIPFEVVPGVSSIHAAPAAAGIPLTHRDHAHGFLVVAASQSVRFTSPEWRAARLLLQSGGTVVVLMGVARVNAIIRDLIQSGCAPDTPAALISKATWREQEVRYAPAHDISRNASGIATPALLVLGNVVGLSPDFIQKISADYANAPK